MSDHGAGHDAGPLRPPVAGWSSGGGGLVCGYVFSPDDGPVPIDTLPDTAPPLPAGGFSWLHVNLAHSPADRWLRTRAGLSDNFIEALDAGSRSTRIERDGDTLFAVINDVTYDFSFDPHDVATLWVAVGRDRVVSARRSPLRSVDRLRLAVKGGERLASSVRLLDHLLRDQADELQRIIRQTAERLDDLEDALLAGRHGQLSAELSRLRRLTVRLHRLLSPEPTALARTLVRPPEWVTEAELQLLHGASEEFALVLRDIAALQERIKLIQEEASTRVAEDNSRSLFTLTMVTVLALPINLVAGLMGMNVGGVPLASHPLGFWLMLGGIAALTALIARTMLRRLHRPPR